jgi:anti-sigma factor RsiW
MTNAWDDPLPEELLSAYLDGECTDDERRAVEARLEVDPAWRAVLAEVRATRVILRGLPPREPPAGFIDSLTLGRHDQRRSRVPAVIAGLAAVAAILAGFVLASPSHRDTKVAPPIATLADSHAATVSLQSDPVSGLAPVAATPGAQP